MTFFYDPSALNTTGFEETQSVFVGIRKAENGFVVSVKYPKSMLGNPAMESMQGVLSALGTIGQENPEGDPTKAAKAISSIVGKFGKTPKPLRKPCEEYIFNDMDRMVKFIKETFEERTE